MPFTPVPVDALRETNPKHPCLFKGTAAYLEGTLDDHEFTGLVSGLRTARDLTSPGRACVVFGRGSRPKAAYDRLNTQPNVEVLWEGPCLPFWAYPLSFVVAAHSGLVRVREHDAVPAVVEDLATMAMAELYSFRLEALETVVRHVRKKRWRADIARDIDLDPSYFCLGVDGDYAVDAAFAWLSLGPDCPPSLDALARRFVAQPAV